jgi:hypothetical protein
LVYVLLVSIVAAWEVGGHQQAPHETTADAQSRSGLNGLDQEAGPVVVTLATVAGPSFALSISLEGRLLCGHASGLHGAKTNS